MNLNTLYNSLPAFNKIKVISKSAEINGRLLDIIGAVLYGGVINICAIEYCDEQYEKKLELDERDVSSQKLCENTYRDKILNDIAHSDNFSPLALRQINAGGRIFHITSSSSTLMSGIDMAETLLLAEFLKCGYNPIEIIRHRDFEFLYFSVFELDGAFDDIPDVLTSSPITLTNMPNSRSCRTSKKLKLRTDSCYPQKISFTDEDTNENYSFYIENVSLMDVWQDMEKQLSDPRITSRVTPEQLEQMKKDMKESLSAVCPIGMKLPVIEYEADPGISLEFFLTEHLNESLVKPRTQFGSSDGIIGRSNSSKASSVGIIGGADGPTAIIISSSNNNTGNHGIKLRNAVIQAPVAADTKEIDVEMLRFFRQIQSEQITVK